MDASTICLRSLAQECNHRSGIFGSAVNSFLRESDLALKEARSDSRRSKIPIPESSCRGGVAVLALGTAAKVQIRNHPDGFHFRLLRLPIQVSRVLIQVPRVPIQVPRVPIQIPFLQHLDSWRLPVPSAYQSPTPLSLQRLPVSSASQSPAPPSL